MTHKAKDYGSSGLYMVPSLSTSAIGAAISSVATSMTDLQSELNLDGNARNGHRRKVRSVLRENF
eukprot:CAMPEP_0202461956 /NCGR_PEP_ID=MMETSP1360-20130828/51806_1 /ASSEMBLY_ACC=CAM_ASM_000848 /TAXON_ID=515479 /ORGANISM="Licmophora paradoxa, Strain CCMP2313" /LENGTH=64 /DNA_ID=CAMNT_0049084233 /DNA_START=63 /DNA_END=254 /DNA_ORIENTATION=-